LSEKRTKQRFFKKNWKKIWMWNFSKIVFFVGFLGSFQHFLIFGKVLKFSNFLAKFSPRDAVHNPSLSVCLLCTVSRTNTVVGSHGVWPQSENPSFHLRSTPRLATTVGHTPSPA
jgi:hypothetical protein